MSSRVSAGPGGTVRVEGLTELRLALKEADRETRLGVKRSLQHSGQLVRDRIKGLASGNDDIGPSSVAGYRSRLRGLGLVVVEQSRRKTTGDHPNYGALQMREAMLPGLYAEQDRVLFEFDGMLEAMSLHFNL